jgi:hypothetical protein
VGATSGKVSSLFSSTLLCLQIVAPTSTKELRRRIFRKRRTIFFSTWIFIAMARALKQHENPNKYNNNPRMSELI